MPSRVLLIDDDARLAELLTGYLGPNGFELAHASDGPRGLAALDAGVFEVVLLDVMMPGMDGLEVGADDYVGKFFLFCELLARLRALLRRADPDAFAEKLQVADVVVDTAARTCVRANVDVDLTALELDILVALMRRAGRAVPRDALLSEAGRADVVVGERTVDVHVSRLRQKLGEPSPIKTIRGTGYLYAKDS